MELVESQPNDFEVAVNCLFQLPQTFVCLSCYYDLMSCKIGETGCLVGCLCGILDLINPYSPARYSTNIPFLVDAHTTQDIEAIASWPGLVTTWAAMP